MPGATLAQAPASQLRTKSQTHVSKAKSQKQPGFGGVNGSSKLKLAKPFSRKARRIIRKKTEKLIKKRNQIDEQLLREVQRKNVTAKDWLPRDKLLRRHTQLEKREERHIRRRTRKLAELERLYRWDPSVDRAFDHNMVRYLLWKFKRHLGPLMDYHGKKGDVDNDTSSSSESGDEWDDVSDQDAEDKTMHVSGKKRKREESVNGRTSKKRSRADSASKEATLSRPEKSKKNIKDGKRKKTIDQTGANLEQAGDG